MEAIIILLIISFQFALIYFGVKYLSALNERLLLLNEKVESLSCLIEPAFEKVRNGLAVANNVMNKYIENEGKIKVIKLIFTPVNINSIATRTFIIFLDKIEPNKPIKKTKSPKNK